ncbi:MAG: transporter [Deltaproteobacteria bacterium HGW-Deltaproteobacteria-18]|jgi:outer membrane protein TolC|nr:MAG: transporter [Deltaproteobacteria bacterium HGW-Deltaproteobacteria-18]
MNMMTALCKGCALLVLLGGLAGCATFDFDQSVARTNTQAAGFTHGQLALARDTAQRDAMALRASEQLSKPLSEPAAVQLALVNSPSFQALLARNWANAADAAQSGRLENPIFSIERLHVLSEVEFGRLLSVGLLDLLTFPVRQAVAKSRVAAEEHRLTRDVVRQVTEVRGAWVRAVAANERLGYARQVFAAAEASAELARRMQQVGNFNTIERVRQQGFYADAATQLALARHALTARQEELIRQLGLSESQVPLLMLPARLPDLPDSARQPEDVSSAARAGNLDVRLAQAEFEAAAKAQGLGRVTSLVDVEAGLRHNTVFDNDSGDRATGRGYELDVTLPLFDWGGMKREAMNARTLAAGHELEAALRGSGSRLREGYSAYRTAHDIARHYREEIIPLQQVLAEENVYRYNAMLIGVFELLADARERIRVVQTGIDTLEGFWLADAALEAVIMGTEGGGELAGPAPQGEARDAGH